MTGSGTRAVPASRISTGTDSRWCTEHSAHSRTWRASRLRHNMEGRSFRSQIASWRLPHRGVAHTVLTTAREISN